MERSWSLFLLGRSGFACPMHQRDIECEPLLCVDITRPIVLAVELGGIENFPGGPRHAGFEATTAIRRKDFGIDLAMPPSISAVALGDVVKVELDLQLLEPGS